MIKTFITVGLIALIFASPAAWPDLPPTYRPIFDRLMTLTGHHTVITVYCTRQGSELPQGFLKMAEMMNATIDERQSMIDSFNAALHQYDPIYKDDRCSSFSKSQAEIVGGEIQAILIKYFKAGQ